jgi:hypothetical protein
MAPFDSDTFTINPNPFLWQDGGSLVGTPIISVTPSDMLASAVTVDSQGFWNFILSAGGSTGLYTITVTFTLNTRGPIHRTCQIQVLPRS